MMSRRALDYTIRERSVSQCLRSIKKAQPSFPDDCFNTAPNASLICPTIDCLALRRIGDSLPSFDSLPSVSSTLPRVSETIVHQHLEVPPASWTPRSIRFVQKVRIKIAEFLIYIGGNPSQCPPNGAPYL